LHCTKSQSLLQDPDSAIWTNSKKHTFKHPLNHSEFGFSFQDPILF